MAWVRFRVAGQCWGGRQMGAQAQSLAPQAAAAVIRKESTFETMRCE